MNKKTYPRLISWCFLSVLLTSANTWSGELSSLNVEPPNWWTGFKETGLQLMVHGENIAKYDVALDYPGVGIERVTRVKSPDYLFVYLDVSAETKPGVFDITFSHDGQSIAHQYHLLEKNPDPEYTRGFSSADNIYLITPDRFANGNPDNDNFEGMGDTIDRSDPGGRHGGDIQGIVDRLDYISELGFTAIWLNPLLENKMPTFSYHGYSTTDFYRVDPRFGSNEEYRDLVGRARSMGIGVIMDMILNHMGSKHWWMQDLPTDDWLNLQENWQVTSHEHISEQDPYAASFDKDAFSDGWFVETMPDLNQRNPLLADYLTQNAVWWIEYLGLAGIRMDTYSYSDKAYLTEWARRVMLEYPRFNIVGEEWMDNPSTIAYWQAGNVNRDGYVSYLPSLMDFPLQNALRWGLVSEEKSKAVDFRPLGLLSLYRTLANDFVYPDPFSLVIFPDNHDMSRIYTQLGEDDDLFRMALAYVLTMRGIPQIYYGTEILMSNPGVEDHGVIRSDFPGGWKGDRKNAFTGEGLSEREAQAQAFVKNLLNWRRDKTVIHTGQLTHFVPEEGTYVYFRHDADDSVMVVLNKNAEETELELSRFSERLKGFQSALDVINGERLKLDSSMSLSPRSVRVLELSK